MQRRGGNRLGLGWWMVEVLGQGMGVHVVPYTAETHRANQTIGTGERLLGLHWRRHRGDFRAGS